MKTKINKKHKSKTRTKKKKDNQIRRKIILRESYKKPLGENLLLYLGGVIQKGKHS